MELHVAKVLGEQDILEMVLKYDGFISLIRILRLTIFIFTCQFNITNDYYSHYSI